jgi:hypothetical protein
MLDVLFLEEVKVGSNSFRRLNIGRIADKELINEFKEAKERDFHLI